MIPSSEITLTITPAEATVAANGTVTFTATSAGFTAKPVVSWYMQEGPATPATPTYCGYLNPTTPPSMTNCPAGYVTYGSDQGPSGTAVYHAPGTAGTYHVVFLAGQYDGFVIVGGKTATAAVTVTP